MAKTLDHLTPEFWHGVDILNPEPFIDSNYTSVGRPAAFRDLSNFVALGPAETGYLQTDISEDDRQMATAYPLRTIVEVEELKVVLEKDMPLSELPEENIIYRQSMYIHGVSGLWLFANKAALMQPKAERRKDHTVVQVAGPEIRIGKFAQKTRKTGKTALHFSRVNGIWVPEV